MQPYEADQRARPGKARGERLLLVADAVGVDVLGLQDRQIAAAQAWGRQTREARPVALASSHADVDGEPRAARDLGDDLASVGDVELNSLRAVGPRGSAEGQVVDAGIGQAARANPCRSTHEHERVEVAAHAFVAGAVRRPQQRVAPDVLALGERGVHVVRVGLVELRLQAGRAVARLARDRHGRSGDRDEEDEQAQPRGRSTRRTARQDRPGFGPLEITLAPRTPGTG